MLRWPLQACARVTVGVSLDEPSQGALAAVLHLGSDPPICMEFGGKVLRDRAASGRKAGWFVAKDAPPPSGCPLP